MNFENNKETNDFLELITTNSLIPLILKPTRITSHSQTLIDNILTNITENKVVAGNITTSISDHLMQFAIFQTDTAKTWLPRSLKVLECPGIFSLSWNVLECPGISWIIPICP